MGQDAGRFPRKPVAVAGKLALFGVASLSVASGCGGNSYKDNVKKAAAQFKKTSTDAGTKLQSAKSKTEFSAGVDEFQGAVRTFNSKLSSLKPPSGAQAAQSHLITVLNTFSKPAPRTLYVGWFPRAEGSPSSMAPAFPLVMRR